MLGGTAFNPKRCCLRHSYLRNSSSLLPSCSSDLGESYKMWHDSQHRMGYCRSGAKAQPIPYPSLCQKVRPSFSCSSGQLSIFPVIIQPQGFPIQELPDKPVLWADGKVSITCNLAKKYLAKANKSFLAVLVYLVREGYQIL